MKYTNIHQVVQPGSFADPLTDVLRNGARALLAQAIEGGGGLIFSTSTPP